MRCHFQSKAKKILNSLYPCIYSSLTFPLLDISSKFYSFPNYKISKNYFKYNSLQHIIIDVLMHTPLYSFIPVTDYICCTFTIEDKAINIWVSAMSQYDVLHSLNIILFKFIHTILWSRHQLHLIGRDRKGKVTCPSKSL